MAMHESDWLNSLKVGDEVAIYFSAAGGGWHQIETVTAVGKKFVSVGSWRYRRNCHYHNGVEGEYASSICPVTNEIREAVKDASDREQCLWRLRDLGFRQGYFGDCWTKLTTDQLRRIMAILDEERT